MYRCWVFRLTPRLPRPRHAAASVFDQTPFMRFLGHRFLAFIIYPQNTNQHNGPRNDLYHRNLRRLRGIASSCQVPTLSTWRCMVAMASRSYLSLGDVELKVVGSPGCPSPFEFLTFFNCSVHREMVLLKSCFSISRSEGEIYCRGDVSFPRTHTFAGNRASVSLISSHYSAVNVLFQATHLPLLQGSCSILHGFTLPSQKRGSPLLPFVEYIGTSMA